MVWLAGSFVNAVDQVMFLYDGRSFAPVPTAKLTEAKRAVAERVRSKQMLYVLGDNGSSVSLNSNKNGVRDQLLAEGRWPEVWDTFVAHAMMRGGQ